MLTFSITTLGCKVNQYDGQSVVAALQRAGLTAWEGARRGRMPNLVVINTCCITAAAMRKSRQAIRRAIRRAPAAAVLVAGCYSDYDGRRILALLGQLGVPPARAAVAGHHAGPTASLDKLIGRLRRTEDPDAEALAAASAEPMPPAQDDAATGDPGDPAFAASPSSIRTRRLATVKANVPAPAPTPPIERFAGHQRAFVKIQDGCDAFCSYCVVPFTRPRVWSRPVEEVLRECRALVAGGHKEIVLCGVFLGAYGRPTAIRRRWDGRPSSLPDLLRRLAAVDGLWRLRLSSLEPLDVTDELLEAMRDLPNIAPHLHLPLQSGSGRILRRMNRQYGPDDYRRAVERIRAALNRPALTTDMIVGFPGEMEEDFAETLELARFAGFAKIHAFPFSPVAGTAAWRHRRDAPPQQVVARRMADLADLEKQLARDYRRQFLGQCLEALVEARRPGSRRLRAMTDRYVPVTFPPPAGRNLTGQVIRLRITRTTSAGLAGELAP